MLNSFCSPTYNEFYEALAAWAQEKTARVEDVLADLGIPDSVQGTVEQLLEARRQVLLSKEAEFITEFGLDASEYNTEQISLQIDQQLRQRLEICCLGARQL